MLDSCDDGDGRDLLDTARGSSASSCKSGVTTPPRTAKSVSVRSCVAGEGRLGAAAETKVEHPHHGLEREQEDRRPAQRLEVESREVGPFAEERRSPRATTSRERRDAELGGAAQGRGQLYRAVAGEGVERGVERGDVLTVEGLGPVEVMATTTVMAG